MAKFEKFSNRPDDDVPKDDGMPPMDDPFIKPEFIMDDPKTEADPKSSSHEPLNPIYEEIHEAYLSTGEVPADMLESVPNGNPMTDALAVRDAYELGPPQDTADPMMEAPAGPDLGKDMNAMSDGAEEALGSAMDAAALGDFAKGDPMMGGAPDIGDPMMELTAVPSVDDDMDG